MALNNVENVSPHIIRQVTKELLDLHKDPPEGVKVIINEHDVTDINVTFEGPDGTPYAGGFFQVKIVLGKNFPADPPKGFFITKIFHPNVAANGEICVNTLKKDWQSSYGIKHILLTIKCLLIVPNAESALNEEAGRLLLEHYNDYFARARLFTDIHAKPLQSTKSSGTQCVNMQSSDRKKSAPFQPLLDKKKILKRL